MSLKLRIIVTAIILESLFALAAFRWFASTGWLNDVNALPRQFSSNWLERGTLPMDITQTLKNSPVARVSVQSPDGRMQLLFNRQGISQANADALNDRALVLPLPDNQGKLYIEIPGNATYTTTGIIAMSLGQVVIVFLLVALYSRGHRIRLNRLADNIERIARSGPGQQLQVDSADELGELEKSVNQMSRSLELDLEKLQRNLARQKDTNRELHEEKIKQKAILDASLDAIISINEKEEIVEFNQVAERIFGYRKEEVLNKPMTDYLMPEAYHKPHKAGFARFIETGENVVLDQRLELVAKRRNGEIFPVEMCISAIHTKEGYLFISYMRDITERNKAETELKLAAHAFASSDAMFISDLNYKVIRINRAFTKMTGLEEDNILNKHVRHLASRSNDKAVMRSIWIKLWEKGRWKGEVLIKQENGVDIPALVTISAVQDAKYKATHYVFHLIDISKQKQYEAILQQAKVDAERASLSKSRFLASMSHEIRTPINGVLGLLGMLEDSELANEQREIVNTATTSGKMLLSIINDVLDFSKMESGNLSLDTQAINLRQTLEQTTELLQPFANRKQIELQLDIHHSLPAWVEGDSDRIAQILMNITNNAIKFTQQGRVLVQAECSHTQDGMVNFTCVISDTGIGIAEDLLPNLFDEFTMADQSYARNKEGTGLGLAICSRLVKLMQGEIQVESELGQGSTFTLTLPLKVAKAPLSCDTGADSGEVNQAPQEEVQKHLIMVVEDNQANCMVVKHQLIKAGYDYVIANDGFEALRLLNEHANGQTDAELTRLPSVILMDISMPGMDGMETTRRIRQLALPYCDLPVIALTAHALSGDKEKFLSAGMDDYLSKPTNAKSLTKHIEALINNQVAKPDTQAPGTKEFGEWIDHAALKQLAEDIGEDVVPELLSLYIDDSEKRIATFKQALLEGDFATLEFEGHTLGSSAAAHGCLKLCHVLRQVEKYCQEGDYEQAAARGEAALEVASLSLTSLRQWLTKNRLDSTG